MKQSQRQNARERRMERRRWEHTGHIEALTRRVSYNMARAITASERDRGYRNTIYVPSAAFLLSSKYWNVIRLDPWADTLRTTA